MKFREQRGSLSDSMKTVFEFNGWEQLRKHLRDLPLSPVTERNECDVQVCEYTYDHRIQWDTHIVTLPGYGVLGFTDGPVRYSGILLKSPRYVKTHYWEWNWWRDGHKIRRRSFANPGVYIFEM